MPVKKITMHIRAVVLRGAKEPCFQADTKHKNAKVTKDKRFKRH